MKATDKLPWVVPVFFFGLLGIAGIYWHTRSDTWFFIAGPLWATLGGSYFLRVFKRPPR